MRITKIGIPPGGNTDQILIKTSDSDYDVEWADNSSTGGSPGGANTQVQFNDGGNFGGDAGLTYDKVNDRLTTGSLLLNTIVNATTDTDKFLVSDGGVLKYRTGTEILSDIGGVSTSRTLTINGTSYDLSANRTWSVGTVTSVGITAGTGISVSGSPITGSGSITVTNSAPDQTVSLTQGGTTTITGTYPNFTISSADQYVGTVTSVSGTGTVNGITLTGSITSSGSLTLGGTLSGVSLTTQVSGTLPIANGGTGSTSFTQGSVIFAGASSLTQDNANFFWDDTNNRLGIGTASPAALIHGQIPSVINNIAEIFRVTDGTLVDFKVYLNRGNSVNTSISVLNTYAGIMSFETNNTERMRIFSSGNVAIGDQTDTGYKLFVNGNTYIKGSGNTSASYGLVVQDSSASNLFLVRNDGAATFSSSVVSGSIGLNAVSTSAGTSQTYAIFRNTGNDFYVGIEGSTNGGFFTGSTAYDNVFYGTSAFNFITSGISRLRVLTTGQLKLGNYTSSSSFTGTAAGYLAFDSSGNILTTSASASSVAGSSGQIQYNSSGSFGAESNLFWDATNNYLGIGTSSPPKNLSVNGTGFNVESVRIGNTSGGDDLNIGETYIGLSQWSTDGANRTYAPVQLGVIEYGNGQSRDASYDATFVIKTRNTYGVSGPGSDSAPTTRFQLYPTGQIALSAYTTTTSFNATSLVGYLGFDANGNILTSAGSVQTETTWTPAFSNSGATIVYATNGQVGYYVKTGSMVVCTFRLALGAGTSMTGNTLTITGLPFTSQNATNREYICDISWASSSTNFVNLQGRIAANTTTLTLWKTTAAGTSSQTAMVGSDITTGSIIQGTITYFT